MDVTRYKRPVKTRRNLKTIDLGLSKVAAEVSSTQSFAEAKPRVAVKPRQTVSDFISKPNPDSVKNIENADEPRAEVLNANNQNNPHTTDDQTIIKDQNTLINMDLPGEESEVKELKVSAKDSRAVIARRWILRSLLVLFVLIIGVGGFLFSNGYIKIHKAFKGSAPSVASLKEDVLPELLKGEGDGRINILLLGRGGGAHDAPDLTDTIILASVDPVNYTATLISIPRDLWVKVAGQGAMKINAVWETGEFKYLRKIDPGSTDPLAIKAGFDEIDKVVTNVLGVPVNYNVIVDFKAFKQAVDTIGGITVNVPKDLYDPSMAWENNWNPLLAKAGVQTFNGSQALIYVRSRETSSDFARSLRQRITMLAIKDKVDSVGTLSNPIKIAGLINTFGNNVASDLSISDASRLYSILKQVPDTSITSVGLSDPPNNFITTGPLNGQSIALPRAGLFDYSAIQTYIRSQLKDGYIVKENSKVLVLNGTTTANLATVKAAELSAYGYNVVATGDAPHIGWVQTTLVDLTKGKAKYTKNYLEKRYGVTAMTTLPDASIQTNGADFVIIIGSNESSNPKT